MNFNLVKSAVASQFARMQHHPMFRVDIDKDLLWSTYLSSFPGGTNPIFRERTEHDCSCCRQFIRAVGDVVTVIDGEIVSVWDVEVPDEPAYQTVTRALSQLVKSHPILYPFLHYEPAAGTDRNFEQLTVKLMDTSDTRVGTQVKTWTHFFVNINSKFVKSKADIPSYLSERRSQHDVLLRSLREITHDAIDTVLDLIAQGSLCRGEEHRPAVVQFQAMKRQFDNIGSDWMLEGALERQQDLFAWTADTSGAVSRIRNTVIGTLLVDLSEGKDLESSVRMFESKVAPTNYKRPTALITKAMIDKAKEKLFNLGLLSALDRRYATIRDIDVSNVLFVDRPTGKTINGDVFDDLSDTADSRPIKNLDKVEEVPIGRFINDIVPRVSSIELMFENRHQNNLVSLIAPCDPTARHLFKWPNNFSWSYAGELADAIKERVKKAGGNVTGDLCCRLAWFNYDDLDFHMAEPGGYEIYFSNRHLMSPSRGRLDVDMNVSPTTREPVENIFYTSRERMKEGEYRLSVHQFNRRESSNVGFECEIDYLGQMHRFAYDKPVTGQVTVVKFRYTHKDGFQIIESLPSSQATRIVWNLPTQAFCRVSTLMMSPNCWNGESGRSIGNQHYFFMLDSCLNDGSARGFFNEFLREDLNTHRKVFEVVGSKMKPIDSPNDQLSGLGFSSTRRDAVICRVKGSFTRTIKIVF